MCNGTDYLGNQLYYLNYPCHLLLAVVVLLVQSDLCQQQDEVDEGLELDVWQQHLVGGVLPQFYI